MWSRHDNIYKQHKTKRRIFIAERKCSNTCGQRITLHFTLWWQEWSVSRWTKPISLKSLSYRWAHTHTFNATHSLTHSGRVTHICVRKLTITGSDNGLSPGRRQAIIWTNAGILLIRPLGTNFSDFFSQNSNIFIQENAFESVVCEKAAILSRPQCIKKKVNTCGAIRKWLLLMASRTSM